MDTSGLGLHKDFYIYMYPEIWGHIWYVCLWLNWCYWVNHDIFYPNILLPRASISFPTPEKYLATSSWSSVLSALPAVPSAPWSCQRMSSCHCSRSISRAWASRSRRDSTRRSVSNTMLRTTKAKEDFISSDCFYQIYAITSCCLLGAVRDGHCIFLCFKLYHYIVLEVLDAEMVLRRWKYVMIRTTS